MLRRILARSALCISIALALVTQSVQGAQLSQAATPPTVWPKVLDNIYLGAIGGVFLTSDNIANVVNCDNVPYATQSIVTFAGSYDATYPPKGKIGACAPRGAIGPTGIVFGESIEYGGYKEHAAYKNGLMLWKKAPLCTSSWAAAYAVGPDGNVYILEDNTGSTCNGVASSLTLASFAAYTGELRFRLPIPSNPGAQYYRTLRPYSQGVVVITGNNRTVAFVRSDGQVIDSFTPPLNASIESLGDPMTIGVALDGTIALPYERSAAPTNPSGCASGYGYILQRKPDGQQTIFSPASPAEGGTCQYITNLRPAPGGVAGIGKRVGTSEQYLVRLVDDDLQVIPLDINGIASPGNVAQIDIDTYGNVIIARNVTPAGTTNNPQVQLLIYGPTNALTHTLFVHALPGEEAQPHSVTGAFGDMATPGYVYIATCRSSNCWSNSTPEKLHRIAVGAVGDQYLRGALFGAQAAQRLTYVALGDSFSSGEGNSPFAAETDTISNRCHRSTVAYPVLLAGDPSLQLTLHSFRACSGATTQTLVDGQYDNNNQLDAINGETDVITLTIGGNDVGFKDFASNCVLGNCSETTSIFSTTYSKITDELPGKLDVLLGKLSAKLPANSTARVLVVGYPRMMPYDDSTWPNCSYLSQEERVAIRRVTTRLNSVIAAAVYTHGYPFEFVDADMILDSVRVSPFAGHELCSTEGYFNGVSLPEIYSFHPNAQGHQAYAALIKRYLQSPHA